MLTNEHVAAYRCYALYFEGASPQVHGTLAQWKFHKCQLSAKLVIMLLLYQGCRKSHETCLVFPAMEHNLHCYPSTWLALIYAVTKPKDTSKQ